MRELRKLMSAASLPCIVSGPLNCELRIKKNQWHGQLPSTDLLSPGNRTFSSAGGLCLETLAVSVMPSFVLLVWTRISSATRGGL